MENKRESGNIDSDLFRVVSGREPEDFPGLEDTAQQSGLLESEDTNEASKKSFIDAARRIGLIKQEPLSLRKYVRAILPRFR